jgi:hypothetical protein
MSFRTAGVNNACWKDQDDPAVYKHTHLILFAKLHGPLAHQCMTSPFVMAATTYTATKYFNMEAGI